MQFAAEVCFSFLFDTQNHFLLLFGRNSQAQFWCKKKILPLLQKQLFITCKEEQCRKQFTSAYNYQLHVKHYEKQFVFVCQICGKGFMNKNHYQSHSYTHLKDKPFPCTICKKRFLTKSNLHRHSATCNVITKKYECVYCGKKFITDANLK